MFQIHLFGYDKYKLKGKGFSLKPNGDAKIVKMIYEMYLNGKGFGEIALTLKELGIAPTRGGKKWYKSCLRQILSNVTYIGKIRYVDNKYIKKRNSLNKIVYVKNPNPNIITVKGLHEPIIDEETFSKVQNILTTNQAISAKVKIDRGLKNPLASILKCSVCGQTMKRSFSRSGFVKEPYLFCPNHCISLTTQDKVEEKVFEGLKEILKEYKLNLSFQNDNEINNLIDATNVQISKLNLELKTANLQKERLYDLLEQGVYDNDTFLRRSQDLAQKIAEIKNKIDELNKLNNNYENQKRNKENIIPRLTSVIETYPLATIEQKNKLLKSCVEKIEYYKPKRHRKTDFQITIYPRI